MARGRGSGRVVADAAAGEALTGELLAAVEAGDEASELARRVIESPPNLALAILAALGRSGEAGASAILLAVAEGSGPRELRKEARRGLHRLRALGLAVPRPTLPPPPSPTAERPAEVSDAWVTISDGVGSRALWLVAERPLGGVYVAAMVLNEIVGMKACTIDETTRRRANQRRDEWQAQSRIPWVELPAGYARQLIGEALELNRESGFAVPREYQIYSRAIGNPAQPFERAIVYDEIPAAEATLNPELLEQSGELFEEDALKGWFFGFDEVQRYALDLLQARQSQIVLSEQLQSQRQERIIANAIRDVVTPPVQRGLRRRLEEAAYVFLKTGRQRQARLAVAAAQRLAEGALTLHPLLIRMMAKSLELAAEVETAKVPIELVRRSAYDTID